MLLLIKEIDFAWNDKQSLLEVNPSECISYFDFRNKVVIKYQNIL